jgi:hypothetical protein
VQAAKLPDKTYIGRIERGFDFLGYHFGPDGLSVAEKTIEKFIARAIRRGEQEPGEACASARIGPVWPRLGSTCSVGSGGFGSLDRPQFGGSGKGVPSVGPL